MKAYSEQPTKSERVCRPPTPLVIGLMLMLAAMPGCSGIATQSGAPPLPSDAPTADAAVRNTPVVPGRAARVFVFAGFGDKCEPLAEPKITVTHPPAKGELSFVPGQETTIQASAQGTCIGQKTKGTGVYYTAHAGAKGRDRFAVTAKLATGETATRTFEVQIAE